MPETAVEDVETRDSAAKGDRTPGAALKIDYDATPGSDRPAISYSRRAAARSA